MYFTVERLERLTSEISNLIYPETIALKNVLMKNGCYKSIEEVNGCDTPWEALPNDEWRAEETEYAWFRSEIVIPESMEGKKVVFCIDIVANNTGMPQFLTYVNDELVQGMDINHSEIPLSDCARSGEKYRIDVQAYSNLQADKALRCRELLKVLDTNIEKIYYDIQIPLSIAKRLQEDDERRIGILGYLEKAVNMIDLRKPYTEAFYSSIQIANDFLEDEFYGKYCGADDIKAVCVGHTHIDVAWMWDLAQTRQKVQRSFSTVLNLMKEYPDYIFMSSQPQLYQFLKEDKPQVYEQVKKRIAEGRWEPEGAMWVEADCNVTSGESFIRQILYGKRFFREEFGVENKILWLPDVFGYSAALPQILKKCGIDYFMTTKISWSEYNKMPYDVFKWEGLDGTEILTYFITAASMEWESDSFTTYNSDLNATFIMGGWKRFQQKALNKDILISYGYGDGGGGPTKKMLENAKRMERGIPGCPAVKLGNSLDFFENLDKNVSDNPKLPKWVGELYLEYHRGTLTTMARNKRYNRKSEFLYEQIEWLASMDSVLNGSQYPKHEIDSGWETICLNQFHDILPGSSIKKVYEDSKEQYEAILSEGEALKKSAVSNIASNITTEKPSVVVFNPLHTMRDEIVYYEDNGETKSFFAKGIPAKGYKVYPVDEIKDEIGDIKVSSDCLENKFFKIKLDKNAQIISIYDKNAAREVLKKGEKANVMQAFEDKPHNHDAWDINIYYQEKMWEINDLQSIEILEEGPLKGVLGIKRKFLDSTIVQKMCIYRDKPRIDFDTTIDWKEKQILLKAAFPVEIHTDKATYDIQFGNVERPTHWNTSWDMAKFEVCGHKWADVSEGNYGVSLLNDCKYGYDIKDSVMRLTLIKSPESPNEDADREMHYFTYSLYPHMGSWQNADTVQTGYELNVPVTALMLDRQDGVLPKEMSFVSCENVIMEVVKQAEESNDIIVRVHECYNRRAQACVSFFKDVKKVYECDLEELKQLEEIDVSSGTFKFDIKPYEIKTFKLVL